MKLIIALSIVLLPSLSFCQSVSDSTIVNNFFLIIAERDSSDVDALLNYMLITDAPIPEYKHKLTREKKIELVKWEAYFLNQRLKEACQLNYHIYSHKNINPELLDHYQIRYKKKEDVYYLVCNNSDRISTAIIIEEGVIVSFFSGVITGNTSIMPVLLY